MNGHVAWLIAELDKGGKKSYRHTRVMPLIMA